METVMEKPLMVKCIVCGRFYPSEDGLNCQKGRYFWTCSRKCQDEFHEKHGLEGYLK